MISDVKALDQRAKKIGVPFKKSAENMEPLDRNDTKLGAPR